MSSGINHKKRSGYSYANKQTILNLSARRAAVKRSQRMNNEHVRFIDAIRRFFSRALFHKEG